MPPKVESFFRFLVTHAMGALACFLSVSSLFTLNGVGRILPLLLLFVGLYLAWHYRHRTPRTRDGIITTLHAPIAVTISYCLCLRSAIAHGFASPEAETWFYLVPFALSIAVMFYAGKGRYWTALWWTLILMIALGPLSLMFMRSGGL